MFPNDDICNIRAAKSAARRIFQKYGVPSQKQSQSKGLGQQQVSGLIKNAYNAINITYDPSSNDISSFMSVFGTGEDGRIQLDKLEQLAVKYLCGEDALRDEKNNPQQKIKQKILEIQQNNLQLNEKTNKQKTIPQQLIDKQNSNSPRKNTNINKITPANIQSKVKNYNLTFLSPKVTESKNYFSSKQNTQSQSKIIKQEQIKVNKKLVYSQVLNQANQIFNQHKNKQKYGITIKQAGDVLSKTYRLIGKTKYNPSQQDIKIWMKLCDSKKNGIIQWVSYQNFVKRMIERQNITQKNLN